MFLAISLRLMLSRFTSLFFVSLHRYLVISFSCSFLLSIPCYIRYLLLNICPSFIISLLLPSLIPQLNKFISHVVEALLHRLDLGRGHLILAEVEHLLAQ